MSQDLTLTSEPRYQPVDGEAIRLSRAKYWLEVILSGLLSFLIWIVYGKGVLLQGGVWIVAFPMILTRVHSLLLLRQIMRDHRIVLGSDRMQLLENADEVLGEVPYANVADAEVISDRNGGKRVVISLVGLREGETFWPARRWLCKTYCKPIRGWDTIVIERYFGLPLEQIVDRLLERVEAYEAVAKLDTSARHR